MNCTWPSWLNNVYADPTKLKGKVHIYTHPTYGRVYAIGLSEGTEDEQTSNIGLAWYDSNGNWLGLSNKRVPSGKYRIEPASEPDWFHAFGMKPKKFLSLDDYERMCRQDPLHCTNYTSLASLTSSAQKPDELGQWWQVIRRLPCEPKPNWCRLPTFITPEWLATHFGRMGRPPVPSELRVDKYLHRVRGVVYNVADSRLADSAAPWFDQHGNFIRTSFVAGWDHPTAEQVEERRQWDADTTWQAFCAMDD